MTFYSILKNVHLALVLTSIAGFVLRWTWRQVDSAWLDRRLVRVLPHLLDTLLLLSGIGLMFFIRQYPITSPWLSNKMLGLLGYILLGAAAMRLAPRRVPATASFVLALVTFAWMISIAVTRDPAGFLHVLLASGS